MTRISPTRDRNIEIISNLECGFGQKYVAWKFGISSGRVSQIWNKKRKHMDDHQEILIEREFGLLI